MAIASTADLLGQLSQYQLLDKSQLAALTDPPHAPSALLDDLVKRGWLTRFQAERISHGKADQLVLGPYALLEQLGEGGMGSVYKARHQMMRRVVVLKLIRQDLKGVEKIARRFDREIQAAARLSHPNIVTAYEAGQHGDTEYFAMEYVDGTDLGQLVLKQGALSIADACEYMRQAALGLQHAHEAGLIHRDIKPDNFLLSHREKTVKMLDLGLCRLQDTGIAGAAGIQLTVRGTALGTPEYMSPEQIRDSTAVDIRSDLYSLGCTFYYLLAGRDAFTGKTPTDVMFAQMKQEPPPIEQFRPRIGPRVVAVLRKMMAKKVGERYQTPAEVAHALGELVANPSCLETAAPATPTPVPEPAAAHYPPAPATTPRPHVPQVPLARQVTPNLTGGASSGRLPPIQPIPPVHATPAPVQWVESRDDRQTTNWALLFGAAVVVGLAVGAAVVFLRP